MHRILQALEGSCITIGRIVERTLHVQLLLCVGIGNRTNQSRVVISLLLFAQIRTQDTACKTA